MARLILLRHGHAVDGGQDLERPLSPRGRQEAIDVGRWMRQNQWLPDAAVTSPARRAQQTMGLVLEAADLHLAPQERQELYTGAPARYLLEEGACTLVVGHNPTIEQAATLLAGAPVHMSPGCAAFFEDGRLVHLRHP